MSAPEDHRTELTSNLGDKASNITSIRPTVPDFAGDKDSEPIVTRRELWSYYLYYSGDNGAGPQGFSLTLFQSLAFAAGYDPVAGPGSSCSAESSSGQCVLPWAGGTKSVSSVVLVASGISFAIMTLIFTTVGSAADYGTFGRWLLLTLTVICWCAQYASISLTEPSRWGASMALYMISFITYGATIAFYMAVFPRLARSTPHARQIRDRYEKGEISTEEYEVEESLEKNRICNTTTTLSYIGYTVTLCLNLTLLLPLKDNPRVNNYVLLLVNSYWVFVGVWWFIFQQPRPGPPIPQGSSYLTIGWKQVWTATKQYKKLPYTFIYLLSFFLLTSGIVTTTTLVTICQNDQFQFSFLQITYLGLVQGITSAVGTFGFLYVQRRWKFSTKRMFAVTNVFTILIPFWGMLGIWTNKIGFHNAWEFWVYNVVFGLFQAPYAAFSQTMMAELCPPGFYNMFFGLLGLATTASNTLGLNVIQAIIEKSGDNWEGFPFLFAISAAACLVLWFGVDVTQGRKDAAAWAEAQREKALEGDVIEKDVKS
ncbi:MFS general substrate transporter [Thelephora terrestris]|uniref:Autophagy-related protein n=1 Tax=Thelephora terrestris TaxID=56493 RepID=A0A9P6H7W2_9AGAM|nr:MFS general substrate transporter [Thelephora terrestris]